VFAWLKVYDHQATIIISGQLTYFVIRANCKHGMPKDFQDEAPRRTKLRRRFNEED
jgi:hypothetical protein